MKAFPAFAVVSVADTEDSWNRSTHVAVVVVVPVADSFSQESWWPGEREREVREKIESERRGKRDTECEKQRKRVKRVRVRRK